MCQWYRHAGICSPPCSEEVAKGGPGERTVVLPAGAWCVIGRKSSEMETAEKLVNRLRAISPKSDAADSGSSSPCER